ncbi:hypothetical protein KC918_05775, partial [Proteus mirabilis]
SRLAQVTWACQSGSVHSKRYFDVIIFFENKLSASSAVIFLFNSRLLANSIFIENLFYVVFLYLFCILLNDKYHMLY